MYLQISLHEQLSKQYIIGEEMIPSLSILHPVYRLLILKKMVAIHKSAHLNGVKIKVI